MKRRDFIKDSSLLLLTQGLLPSLLRSVAYAAEGANAQEKVLVVIFQRGAADGLSMVPPIGDPGYNKILRPSTYLSPSDAIKLDDFFYLHPALKDLMPLWEAGNFAVIHQVGSPNATRSHFDAQDYMESGVPGIKSVEDGFLDRVLLKIPDANEKSIFKGIAMQPSLPRAFWGKSGAFAMNSISEFTQTNVGKIGDTSKGFEAMYDGALDQALRGTGQQTFEAMKVLKNLPTTSEKIKYPKGKLSKHLSEIARMIKGKVGLRVAMTDCGGWDTHQKQGGSSGQLAGHLAELGGSIAAFMEDLGPMSKNVCLVTMTEFGRTVKENGNGGTDHGHGSVMFMIGDAIKGRQVRSRWSDLSAENLFEGRDLPVTTDFRDVWCEIFASHLTVPNPKAIFQDFTPSNKMIGLFG